MNRTTKAGLLGLGLIVSLPLAAVAPTVEKIKVDREQVVAQFETTDASGCIVTSASLLAGEFVAHTKPDRSTFSSRTASYVISRFDICNGGYLVFMNCLSDAFSMRISRDLQNAQFSDPAVFCFDEVRNIGVYIDVNVTLQATERARREKTKSRTQTPGFHSTFQSVGMSAQAVASGTIVEVSTNYASAASVLAQISGEASSGSEFVKN